MGILDSLSSILQINIPSLKKINLQNISGIQINSNNKTVTKIINNYLIVNPNNLKTKNKEKLSQIIKKYISEDEGYIIQESSQKLLEDFIAVDNKKSNQDIVDFFRNKIPVDDLEALRASLYLRDIKERDASTISVDKIKWDIYQKFGKRGRNIANLCTANYFEDLFKPLYKELELQPDFSIEKFRDKYEKLVNEVPFAVFANKVQTEAELKKEILTKMNRNKKYGIHSLNLHAIGRENVRKIENVLKVISDEILNVVTDSSTGYIIVKIYY